MADGKKQYDFSDFESPAKSYDFSDFGGAQKPTQQRVVENRMPEGLAWGRFMVKNLGTDQLSSVNYLKKEYGKKYDFDIEQGDIIARKKGEKTWGKLDPSGFDIQDISDVAYDATAGLASGAATALGGLGGSILGLGLGGIPGAMVAGSGSSAALEALRQGLGNIAGVSDGVDRGSLATSTALGFLSPILFGTGATAAGAAKALAKNPSRAAKFLEETGFSPTSKQGLEEASKILMQKQKSALTRLFPKTARFFTGLDEDDIITAGQQAPNAVKTALKLPPETDLTGLESFELMKLKPDADKAVMSQFAKETRDAIKLKDKSMTMAWDTAIDTNPTAVDVNAIGEKPIKESIKRYLANKKTDSSGNPLLSKDQKAVRSKIKDLQERVFYDEIINIAEDGTQRLELVPKGKVSLRQSKELEQELQRKIDAINLPEVPKPIRDALIESNSALSDINRELVERVHPGLEEAYKKWQAQKEILKPFISNDGISFEQKLKGLPNKKVLFQTTEEIDQQLGTEVSKAARFSRAKSLFQYPATDPISTQGTTSTSKTIPAALFAKKLFGVFGETAGEWGQAVGSKLISPAVVKKAMQGSRLIQKGVEKTGVPKGKQALLNALSDRPLTQSAISGAMQTPVPWLQMMNERGD